jgi:hypothetical protein
MPDYLSPLGRLPKDQAMNRLLCRTAVLLVMSLSLTGTGCSSRTPSRKEHDIAPRPEIRGNLKVLLLEGTPRNHGLIHGQAMKEPIHQVVRLWKDMIAKSFKVDADEFIHRFVQKTQFLAAMEKWTPDLLEEIRGLAEGAGTDLDTMLLLQLPDEVFIHGQAIAGDRCSSLGFGKDGNSPSCIAQNMDVPSFADGFQLVLHVKEPDSDTEAFVLTQAGCIGLNGMNSHAIGICCNALWQLSGRRDGLPVACIVRGVLQQRSEKDAIAFLRRVKHASGQNYVLGGPAHVYCFECSADRIERFEPKGLEDVVWHTNHPLVNDDGNSAYRELRKDPKKLEKAETDTRARLRCLEKRLTDRSPARNVDLIKAILTSRERAEHPVCRPKKDKDGAFTFASTIMVLSDNAVLHIAPGPPDVTAYETLSFTRPR